MVFYMESWRNVIIFYFILDITKRCFLILVSFLKCYCIVVIVIGQKCEDIQFISRGITQEIVFLNVHKNQIHI